MQQPTPFNRLNHQGVSLNLPHTPSGYMGYVGDSDAAIQEHSDGLTPPSWGDRRVNRAAEHPKGRKTNYGGPTITATSKMADRYSGLIPGAVSPEEADRLKRLAAKIKKCGTCQADGKYNNRCGLSVCPRCSGRKARKYRETLEDRMAVDKNVPSVLVTIGVGVDDLTRGIMIFRHCFAKLRRRKVWTDAVVWGEFHITPEPTRVGAIMRWNLHAHGIVETRPNVILDSVVLHALWQRMLGYHGLGGSIHVKPVTQNFVRFRR